MEFFGIKENRMLEREAMVGVWDYILDNGLVVSDCFISMCITCFS